MCSLQTTGSPLQPGQNSQWAKHLRRCTFKTHKSTKRGHEKTGKISTLGGMTIWGSHDSLTTSVHQRPEPGLPCPGNVPWPAATGHAFRAHQATKGTTMRMRHDPQHLQPSERLWSLYPPSHTGRRFRVTNHTKRLRKPELPQIRTNQDIPTLTSPNQHIKENSNPIHVQTIHNDSLVTLYYDVIKVLRM